MVANLLIYLLVIQLSEGINSNGEKPTREVNTKCAKDPCPKGTFCVQHFDSYYCFCNETSKEKPKGCYGCLEGWFTSPDTNQCYIVVKNLTLRKLSSDCKRLHGIAITNTSANLFLLAYLLDNILKNESTADQSLLQLLIENSTHVMPICQRIKSPVNGTYPWTTWPSGSYGLPMAESGCPEGHSFEWDHGFYKQYTEQTKNQNEVSGSFHLFGEVTKEFVYRGFCIKMEESVGEWPNGQYCIYKKGTNCPPNMVEGELFWDDEDTNNTNTASGTLPEGMFKKDTQIFYCCTTGEINQDGILLPRDRPFYLFPYKLNRCQHVIGTESSLEYIQYDLENYFAEVGAAVAKGEIHPYAEIVTPGLHLKIYYCYYKPIKSCGRPHHSDFLNYYPNKTYQVGEVVRYICKNGYKNIGDEYDECLPSEHWSSITGPNCVDINECTDSHACHVKANCHNSIGSYSCKCNPGWIGNGQDCKVISCLSPTPPENGIFSDVLIKDEFAIGAQIFVKCDPNYLLIGSDSFMCLETGQWKNPFPVCIEKSLCVEQSYICKSSNSYRNQKCSCRYVNKGNFTYVTNPTEITDPSNTTLIAALTTGSLALVSMILIAIVFTFVKWRRRERRLRDFCLKTNTSIYADIEEFKLNFNMNAKRESCCPYFSANTDAVLSWDGKPNLPPRLSVFKSVSDSNCQSHQPNSPVSNFRRHSDFPSSDSFLLPPNQFLSTISHEKLKRSFPTKQYNGPNATTHDDVAPAITERRISNVPAFSVSIASQSCEEIGSLNECDEYIENPYIDMNTDQISIRSENQEFERSLMTELYGQIPKNTLRISLRHRSYTVGNTDKIEAEKKENKLNKRNCFSSHSLQTCSHSLQTCSRSLQTCSHSLQTHNCSFQHNFDPCYRTCPNRSDKIHIINSWEDTDERLKFVGETDFSIRLKLASIMKKSSKDWKVSMEEFSSRLFRYKIRSKLSSGRKRSDTNPL